MTVLDTILENNSHTLDNGDEFSITNPTIMETIISDLTKIDDLIFLEARKIKRKKFAMYYSYPKWKITIEVVIKGRLLKKEKGEYIDSYTVDGEVVKITFR